MDDVQYPVVTETVTFTFKDLVHLNDALQAQINVLGKRIYKAEFSPRFETSRTLMMRDAHSDLSSALVTVRAALRAANKQTFDVKFD